MHEKPPPKKAAFICGLDINLERVCHFAKRASDRMLAPSQVVIVITNVDDEHGGPIADALMPGNDWQKIRDRGEIPFARGLALRAGIEDTLKIFDAEAAKKLKSFSGLAVVVVDHGVAEIFPAEETVG